MGSSPSASASQRPLLWRVRHGAFGIDSLSQSSYLKWAVGNIARADLQTVGIVSSRPKKSRDLAATTPCPALLPVYIRPQYFRSLPPLPPPHHGTQSHSSVRRPMSCSAPLLISSSSVPESPHVCVCVLYVTGLGPGPRLAERIPPLSYFSSLYAYPRWPCRSSAS